MARFAFLAAAALSLLLTACGAKKSVVLTFDHLPKGTTSLDLKDVPPWSARTWDMHAVSHLSKRIRLQAHFLDPAPEKITVRLLGQTNLDPLATGLVKLQFNIPRDAPQTFSGKVAITSPDLPSLRVVYTFAGNLKALPSQIPSSVAFDPDPVELGDFRPGEKRVFTLTLRNHGKDTIVLGKWDVPKETHLRKLQNAESRALQPGSKVDFKGLVEAPHDAGAFREKFSLHYDQSKAAVTLQGKVVPPYDARPRSLDSREAVAARQPVYSVTLFATKGEKDFRVAQVRGAAPYFEVVSVGGKDPAQKQEVTLRLSKTAPLGPAAVTIQFVLDSGLVVSWPVRLRVMPPIYSIPARVVFGKVPASKLEGLEREVRIANPGGASDFELKSTQTDHFVAVPRHPAGLSWSVTIRPQVGLPPGIYRDTIELQTTDPETPTVSIETYLEVTR